jgi:predicted nucleic acid-binding protein
VTIAVDASAAIEYLVPTDARLRDAVVDGIAGDPHWVVPEHFVLETVNGLRGRWLGGHLSEEEFVSAVTVLAEFEFDVWPTAALLPRVMQLAANATSYDAAYLALAEELNCRLVTADAKLARVPGIRCRIVGAGQPSG